MIKVGHIGYLAMDFKILTFRWDARHFLIQLVDTELDESIPHRLHIPLATSFINRGYYPYLRYIAPNSQRGIKEYGNLHPYRANSINFVDYNHEIYRIEYIEGDSYYSLVSTDSKTEYATEHDIRDRITMFCNLETVGMRNNSAYRLKDGYHSNKLIWGIITRIRESVGSTSVEYNSIPNSTSILMAGRDFWVTLQDPQYFTEFELPFKYMQCDA